ncbi:hypothetical protein TNCV_4288471 [Trichonephila clavipes]|nr:hypothetical protein TNCV_4288471 [Trichonephila clavipes]
MEGRLDTKTDFISQSSPWPTMFIDTGAYAIHFLFEKQIGDIGNKIEDVVDLARQINLEVNSHNAQELQDFIEMQEQGIEELKS